MRKNGRCEGKTSLLLACLAAGLLQGCTTMRRVEPTHRHEPMTPQPQAGHAAQEHVQMINMKMQPTGGNAAGEQVARRIASQAEGVILAQGYTIAQHSPEVVIGLRADVSEFDRSGNYYRHEGTLDATVSMPATGRMVGTRSFTERGERKLGEAESLRGTADQLAQPAVEWLQTLTGNLSREIGVTDIIVRRTGVARRISRTAGADDADYAGMFIRRVNALAGVISCELVEQNYRTNEIRFRVMYHRRSFPEGVLNRLIGYSELELRP